MLYSYDLREFLPLLKSGGNGIKNINMHMFCISRRTMLKKGEPAFGQAGPGNLQTRAHSCVVDLKPRDVHVYGIEVLSEQPFVMKIV